MQLVKLLFGGLLLLMALDLAAQSPRDSLLLLEEELEEEEAVTPSDEAFPIDSIPTTVAPTKTAFPTTKRPGFVKRFWTKDYPSPKKAAILSLILPGTGQIYNKKYWKVPIVYAGIGALVYAIDWNGSRYRQFRDAYIAEVNGEEHEFTDFEISADGLKAIRNSYDKNLQLSYVGMFLVYALNSIDAYVDAHLLRFDVSEDLSLHVNPKLLMTPNNRSNLGIGLSLQPAPKKKQQPTNFLYGF
ncbi:MAG: DUF5683 domain-containing protein [Saprospiraceae bacterium]